MIGLGVFLVLLGCAHGQLTAQSSVAPNLRECYLDPILLNRNNLPPTTIQVLIDIIQKVEDASTMDLRQISSLLLHTFRQDGIEYHQPDVSIGMASNVLPFAPTGFPFHRHRLLLSRLIPSNLQALDDNILNSTSKCALHHMLSTSVDNRVRGNENTCNQLSQYRAQRTIRNIRQDVEILNAKQLKYASKTHGHMRQMNPNDDVEYSNYGGSQFEKQIIGSSCPLLSGVVSTGWGAVSAGNLIAGIAAGAQPQQVPIIELVKGSVMNYNDAQQFVNSIYPATLSGDLAEAVLIQGTERGSANIVIGAAGSFNSSEAHRYFMINRNINLEMTDPEIRGGIDGFVLGSIVPSSLNAFSTLRLSQFLDMYYSSRNGVYDPAIRACNRRTLGQQQITNDNLIRETYAFASALDTNMPLRGTIIGGLQALVTNAVTNYQSYASTTLNDGSCNNDPAPSRMKTNLYIVLDSSWQYEVVYPAISYLLDSIEVGKHGSSVTILSAFDGSILVNTTFSLADFHSQYTLEAHRRLNGAIDLHASLRNIRLMMQDTLRTETLRNYVGGNATVLLYMIYSGTIVNNNNVWEEARLLNNTVPDLKLIFTTATNQFDNLWNLVRDMTNDIKTVSLSSTGVNVNVAMTPVLTRIQEVGRRIINPLCGPDFNAGASGLRRFEDYIEPGYVNYYAISPNYFYGQHDNRKLRVLRGNAGATTLRVCYSRYEPRPIGSNGTSIVGMDQNTITCENIASSGNSNVEIGLQNACDGHDTINSCPPYYLSVEAVSTGTALSAICTDSALCRFPYNIRFQIEVDDLGCFSSAASVGASLLIILSAYILTLF